MEMGGFSMKWTVDKILHLQRNKVIYIEMNMKYDTYKCSKV